MSLLLRLSALLIAAFAALPAAAQIDESELLPIEEAFALSAEARGRDTVVVRFEISDGYYLYRHRFGISAGELALAPFSIPDGEHKVDEFFGEVESYRGSVELTQSLPPIPAGQDSLTLEVRFQGCADIGICYPPHRSPVTVALPPAAALPASTAPNPLAGLGGAQPGLLPGASQDALPEDQAFGFEAIALGPDRLLVRMKVAPGYYLYRDKTRFAIEGAGLGLLAPDWPPATPHRDEHFGEVMVYFDSIEVPLPVTRGNESALTATLSAEFQGCKTAGICYPVMRRSLAVELPAGAGALVAGATAGGEAGADGAGMSIASALLFALLGGLILNLMPCVLPILSLKAMGLAKGAHGPGYARRHALWYTAGVLASFAALGLALLALRAGGSALGWGFQLQQPLFVAALVYVMLAIGLSMSGVFVFGASWGGVGQSLTEDEGAKGAFFTGVLAVVVASPCTAPFMGGALAYAVAQPAIWALSVFLALGLGLALPFLLIGLVPSLADRLPRPGPWMETLKQFLAFPMYLTGVWLLWVLGHQVGMDGAGAVLAGGVALAMALWWWEHRRGGHRGWRLAGFVLLLALAAWPLNFVRGLEAPAKSAGAAQAQQLGEAWSSGRLDELLAAGKPVLVNMTADWCATCKVNERLVLSTDDFAALLADTGTAYLKGDWTNTDPEITAYLKRFNAVGVPLYVVYPAGGGKPEVLPAVLTATRVEEALRKAAGGGS
jgi:thiol:disulfide interchange protein DsbD